MILTSQGAVLQRQVAQTKPDRADRVQGGGVTVFQPKES
jgi:hypothetical protein